MEYIKKAWAFLVRRLSDIVQLVVAGSAGAVTTLLANATVTDDVSVVPVAAGAVLGRLVAYANLNLKK